jgi:hypothetical protein
VWFRQVALSLRWLKAFFSLKAGPLICERFADEPGTLPVVMFDASTTGGGALLWVLPRNREITAEEVMKLKPWAYIAQKWDGVDERLTFATFGDSAGQARWECYMLLLDVGTWPAVIFRSRGLLRVIGDALGIMHAAGRFKSHDPAINLMCMEMALIFAPKGVELEAVRLWSELNDIADALSRLHEGAVLPHQCAQVTRALPRRGGFRALGRLEPEHSAE